MCEPWRGSTEGPVTGDNQMKKPLLKWLAGLACIVAVAGAIGLARHTWSRPRADPPPARAATGDTAAAAELGTLLNEGSPAAGMTGYYQPPSRALVAAAAGADDSRFRRLGELLVRDGRASTIINLSREMNGSWYEWSEQRAPSSEPDAFIRAWRHVVTAMRSVPGQHFRFLWTIFPGSAAVAECWPGSAYVDYVGTDVFDWYGGPDNTYPHTASGARDFAARWQETLTAVPGGLNWMARFSQLTGKPVIVPEWGLDFHPYGGNDDTYFLSHMTAWLKAHHAIGLYWIQGHVAKSGWPGGPLLAGQGASALNDTPRTINGMGKLLGGHLQYAGAYLQDHAAISDAMAQLELHLWQGTPYQLILSVDIIPNPPALKSYAGPPSPGHRSYQLSDYPDAVAELQRGLR